MMKRGRWAWTRRASLALAMGWGAGCTAVDAPRGGDEATTVLAASSTFRGDLRHTGVFDGPEPRNLARVRWSFPTEGTVRGTPAVSGNRVYVGSSDGHLYALDRASGSEIWRFDAGSGVQSVPAVEAGRIYVTTRAGSLIALGSDGTELWTVGTGAVIPFVWGGEGWDYWTGSPVVAGDRVVFGAGDGIVRVVDAATGSPLWEFATEGRIRATPAVASGRVVIGSFDGIVYALDLRDGSLEWAFESDGTDMVSEDWGFDRMSIQSSAAIADGVVYVGARDANLYALDLATGERRWAVNDNTAWVIASPAVTEGVVYSATSSSGIAYAVDAESGRERWRRQMAGPVFGSPAVVGDVVVVTDHGGYVSALDRSDGEVLWRFRTGDDVKSSPVVEDGVVYVGSDDGQVYALESGPEPTPRRAVFWDEALSPFSALRSHETLMEHFRFSGYEVLDAPALAAFMRDRVADGVRSVVVFAQDWVPHEVAPEAAPETLFRRYLDAGGKVVWMGFPPMAIGRDPETAEFTDYDLGKAEALLGVAYDLVGDDYGIRATADGRRWGLPEWWTGFGGITPSNVSQVLGSDENGRASAWVQRYGGPDGTGFVHVDGSILRTDLDAMVRVAEYGILR